MNIRSIAAWSGTAVLALSLAACGAFKNSVPTPPNPSTCVLPAGVQTQVLYPIPGATGVPDAPQQIVFAISTPLPNWGVATLIGNTGSYGLAFQTITAGQVPMPSATPSFANPIYVSSALTGSFPAATSVGVYLNNGASDCLPLTTGASFTTQ